MKDETMMLENAPSVVDSEIQGLGVSTSKPTTTRLFLVSLVMALCVLNVGIWLSSGTLAPYAATFAQSIPTSPCQYLVNIDHNQFKAAYWMLAGMDRPLWERSVVLRRILYPLVSYPLMLVLGFEIGGFVFNLLLHSVVFAIFVVYLKNKFSVGQSLVAMWLLALYPGIYYWAGLPYSYAAIVPCCLLGFILLTRLSEEDDSRPVYLLCVLTGILFLAYDLFPFFGAGALLILLYRKKYKLIPGSLLLLVAPSVVSNFILTAFVHVPLMNSNTKIYPMIVKSYFAPFAMEQWTALLKALPLVAYHVYLYSNFLFIPLLFAVLLLAALVLRRFRLSLAERSLLVAGTVLFLFLNIAPPYGGWQMRGVWIARLYQPVFVALVSFCSREIAEDWKNNHRIMKPLAASLVLATCLGNFFVVFGPVMHNQFSSHIYYRFYRHSPPDTFYNSLTKYGRRPLGFCAPSVPPVI
ncbi:MAG TPA: hypothetical protein VF493_21320 [Terriglobales bacterium]